jgi:hypothetical protein
MSAASGAIGIEPQGVGRPADVRTALRRLAFRRRLWRGVASATFGAASALALLCLLGALDNYLSLSRTARIIPVSAILLALLLGCARAAWQLSRRPALIADAREIERAASRSGNALVTFCENLEGAETAASAAAVGPPYMIARLSAQTRNELATIDERLVAPPGRASRGAMALAFMLLFVLALSVLFPRVFALEAQRLLWPARDDAAARKSGSEEPGAGADVESVAVTIEEFRVRVVPPAYAGLAAEEAPGDGPIRALAGSQIEIVLRARGPVAGTSLVSNGVPSVMRSLGENRFSGSFVAGASGAFEARVIADERLAPAPVVRAVEVYADAPPEARITEPGGDQLLRAVPAVPVGVRFAARDDLGLASVTLKYIKSRGEGDAAKFTSGEISLAGIERVSAREWRGALALDLARLGMQAGDTIVFWIEARDRNPSAGNTGRSASLSIAVRVPEATRLNLSDLLPAEVARFLLSQRQIIIKTEKLHSERARLAQDELVRRATDIAADQREFKNSFNDYIKLEGAGEADNADAGSKGTSLEEQARAAEEERTAPHFHGIPEPPTGAPASVREMVYAIRAMWDAEDALSMADTAKALIHEREALTRLKRAQTAVRYIPPIVAQSKPVDLKRRYAGELAEIRTRLERLARRPPSKEAAPLRAALADAYAALGDLQATLNVSPGTRSASIARARERSRQAADSLIRIGGDHAATIGEAAGQLRIVEAELARLEAGGTNEEYAARLVKPLALLAQAAANLFAIAESNTSAGAGEAGRLLPADDARAAEYFRRLGGQEPRRER